MRVCRILVLIVAYWSCYCDCVARRGLKRLVGARAGAVEHPPVKSSEIPAIPVTPLPASESPTSASTLDKRESIFRLNFIGAAIRRSLAPVVSDPDIRNIVSTIISGVIWAYVILSAMGTLGFDTKPLLSLFGIGGFTFGFGIKDLLSDAFSGLYLQFSRPFQRGDVVTVGGQKGRVQSVDIRYVTLLNEAEGAEILVPVASVYKSEIKIHRQ